MWHNGQTDGRRTRRFSYTRRLGVWRQLSGIQIGANRPILPIVNCQPVLSTTWRSRRALQQGRIKSNYLLTTTIYVYQITARVDDSKTCFPMAIRVIEPDGSIRDVVACYGKCAACGNDNSLPVNIYSSPFLTFSCGLQMREYARLTYQMLSAESKAETVVVCFVRRSLQPFYQLAKNVTIQLLAKYWVISIFFVNFWDESFFSS